MKTSLAFILQIAVVLIGMLTLAFLLWEPHIEGRNTHATLFEIYFKDPFLAYAYLGSAPFFVALYRAFGLLGQLRQREAFSRESVAALRTIKHCALAMIGFVAGGVVWILMFGDPDDRPAGVFMSLLVTLVASLIATAAALLARSVQNALLLANGRPG